MNQQFRLPIIVKYSFPTITFPKETEMKDSSFKGHDSNDKYFLYVRCTNADKLLLLM